MKNADKMDFTAGGNDSGCNKTYSVKKMITKNRAAYEKLIASREDGENI